MRSYSYNEIARIIRVSHELGAKGLAQPTPADFGHTLEGSNAEEYVSRPGKRPSWSPERKAPGEETGSAIDAFLICVVLLSLVGSVLFLVSDDAVDDPIADWTLNNSEGCAGISVHRKGEEAQRVVVDLSCIKETWPDAELEIRE